MKAKRKCPICSEDDVSILQNIKMKLIDKIRLPQNYNVVSCDKCGFCYADTNATKEDYDLYYINNNVYSNMPKTLSGYESKFSYFKNMLSVNLNYESILLNIGIGDGAFEVEASEHGYTNIVGVDPSRSSVEKLKAYGIRAYEGSVYDSSYKKYIHDKIDGVFLFDVLEHLLDLDQALKSLLYVIETGTKIFVTVPNCGNIERNITPVPNNFNQEHINYFSKYSLKNLFRKYGFEEVYCKETVEIIYSMYIYSPQKVEGTLEKDEYTINSIKKYFGIQKKIIEDKKASIDKLVTTQEPIIIWGIGAYTMQLFSITNLKNCNIKYCIDGNPLKEGCNFNGYTIKMPNKISIDDDHTIIVSSMLYAENIKKEINNINSNLKVLTI